MSFTNINYISLAHLLPLLIDYQKRRIADLERDLGRIGAAETLALVRQILEIKGRHLQTLQELAKPKPHGAAA